ncbi:MAG: hypothetical protein GX442_19185 [Candidatus Riflebacteria bacterium]|nr:hypothetical protein [Candidatus Riflebacteria bacterium]
MGFLSFLKGMKNDELGAPDLVLRTSRSCVVLGILCLLTGLGAFSRAVLHLFGGGGFWVALLGVAAGGGFAAGGLFILTYRKSVIVSERQSRIEYMESGLLAQTRATFHFRDVLHLELGRVSEFLCASQACLWLVKAYVRRGGGFDAVRLFEGNRADEALEVAHRLSAMLDVQVYQEDTLVGMRSFTSQVGL